MRICSSKDPNLFCCCLLLQVLGRNGTLFYLNAFANSGAWVLVCSGGVSSAHSVLVAFPCWQNHLYKLSRFPDDAPLSILSYCRSAANRIVRCSV